MKTQHLTIAGLSFLVIGGLFVLLYIVPVFSMAQTKEYFFDLDFYIEDCFKRKSLSDPSLVDCVYPPGPDKCGSTGNKLSNHLICGDVITMRRNPENRTKGVFAVWKEDHKRPHIFFGDVIQEFTGKDPFKFCFSDDWDSSRPSQLKILTLNAITLGSSGGRACEDKLSQTGLPLPPVRREAICKKDDVITWRVDSVGDCDDIINFEIPPDDGQGTGSGNGMGGG